MGWIGRDVILVGLVALISQLDVWAPLPFVQHQSHRLALGVVFGATSLALLYRRRAPLTVLAGIYASYAVLYLAIGAPEALGTLVVPLIALYSVGRYSETRSLAIVVALAVLGTALHELKDPQFELNGPAIFFWALTAGAWPLGRAFRERERTVEALSERTAALERQRDAEARAARSAERARIARELHDVVGHGVSVTVLQLVGASGMLEKGDSDSARGKLLATERSARQTLAEMRRLLELLDEDENAALAPQPGVSDLHRLASDTCAAGVSVELIVSGDRVELPAGLELAVYRVAQEALTNVIKHAQPANARVRLSYGRSAVRLEVTDNGATPVVALNSGRGIAGMRERVSLYGGTLAVGPRPDGVFAVSAEFPIEEK